MKFHKVEKDMQNAESFLVTETNPVTDIEGVIREIPSIHRFTIDDIEKEIQRYTNIIVNAETNKARLELIKLEMQKL